MPNQSQLADYLGIDRSVLPYVIDDLAEAGLVERQSDPADRRARKVVATSLGVEPFRTLENTVSVAEAEDYDAIHLTGGHGVMCDFHQSQAPETLIARFYETDRLVSAVCHGPCGLLDITLSNGEPLGR